MTFGRKISLAWISANNIAKKNYLKKTNWIPTGRRKRGRTKT
jgi:hypothetical protein